MRGPKTTKNNIATKQNPSSRVTVGVAKVTLAPPDHCVTGLRHERRSKVEFWLAERVDHVTERSKRARLSCQTNWTTNKNKLGWDSELLPTLRSLSDSQFKGFYSRFHTIFHAVQTNFRTFSTEYLQCF